MKNLMGLLSVMAILGALPAAAEDDPVLLQASTQDIQAPEPSEPPPAQAPASTGQWVYTSEVRMGVDALQQYLHLRAPGRLHAEHVRLLP